MSWPLVGRSEEMDAIEAAISTPDVAGIMVSGAAGVGKSRVVREAVSAAALRGFVGRWTIGTSAARALPLGAFAAWAQSGLTDTVQLVRGVIESLTAAPPGTTVVVGVDDVHLLDDLSIFVLHQIVQRGAAKVLLTVRAGEEIPAAIQELWKVGQIDRLDLQPLSAIETTTLLSTTLGGVVDPAAAQRLWNLSLGNVLYLRNIVDQEVVDGRLKQQHGCWRWTGDPIMPPGLVELIESRIGALPAAVSNVMDALAVAEPIELAALTRITDPTAVEEADIRGLISLEHVGTVVQVRVAHPLYGEVRRRRAAPTRLRRLRGLVAAELARSEDPDDIRVLVRRATLTLDSDLTPDADLLVGAARGAIWLADLPLADRLTTAAVRAGAGPEANFLRAHALSWLSRGEDADAVLAQMNAERLTGIDRARAAFLRASNLLWVLGDPDRAKDLIDNTAAITPPEARGYIDAFLTVYWFAMDRPDLAMQASSSLALADLPDIVGAEIAWVLAVMYADAGRGTEAVGIADAGYRAATSAFDAPQMRFNIADAHVSALVLTGQVLDAGDVADRVRREAADLPGDAQLLSAAVEGRVAFGTGRLDTAAELLEQATVGLTAAGHALGWGYRYQVPRATALAIRGSVKEAADVLMALDKLRRRFRSLDYELSLARAWVAAGQGAVSEAIAVVLAASERASANGQFAAEVLLLQTATQFGDRSGGRRLRELEATVAGPRVGIAARFAEAMHDGDPARLATLSEEFERMGDLVAAVDAAAHAAIQYRNQELRGSALGCSTRADALAERCGGASTPALRQASQPVSLTDREREIVMLIGAGLSNRDVAQRLTLSVRTVESHIYRAMARTGTTSRDELANLLLPRSQ